MSIATDAGPMTLPQPDQITLREKEDAMGAYLMMFAAWGAGLPFPLINLIAAAVYFVINSKRSKFVSFHAYQSLLTQIPISLFNAGLLAWAAALFFSSNWSLSVTFVSYAIFVALWNLIYMIFSIIACIAARKGRFYYFWVFGRLAFARYYLRERTVSGHANRPPEGL